MNLRSCGGRVPTFHFFLEIHNLVHDVHIVRSEGHRRSLQQVICCRFPVEYKLYPGFFVSVFSPVSIPVLHGKSAASEPGKQSVQCPLFH